MFCEIVKIRVPRGRILECSQIHALDMLQFIAMNQNGIVFFFFLFGCVVSSLLPAGFL